MINRRTAFTTLGILAVSTMLLTGCSAGAQSKIEACSGLLKAMPDATSSLQSAISNVTSDPTAAKAALDSFDTKMSAAVDKVGNADVKKVAEKAAKAVHDLDKKLGDFIDDPSKGASALSTSASAVQSTFNKLASTCNAA